MSTTACGARPQPKAAGSRSCCSATAPTTVDGRHRSPQRGIQRRQGRSPGVCRSLRRRLLRLLRGRPSRQAQRQQEVTPHGPGLHDVCGGRDAHSRKPTTSQHDTGHGRRAASAGGRANTAEHRVDQQLEAHRDLSSVGSDLGQGGSEAAAGAVPANGDPGRVHAQLVRVVVHPAQRGMAVLEPGRERVLRGKAVVDADDHDVQVVGEPAAQLVVCVGMPHDQAAAMDPQQRPGPAGSGGSVVDEHLDRIMVLASERVLARRRSPVRRAHVGPGRASRPPPVGLATTGPGGN